MPKPAGAERVHVYCRIRPNGRDASATHVTSGFSVAVTGTDQRATTRNFEFDGVYSPDAGQQAVYDEVGAPILDAVLQGYNGTVLAYGQTGAGKTHTLGNVVAGKEGVVWRALSQILTDDAAEGREVRLSYVQFYLEGLYDLLEPKNEV